MRYRTLSRTHVQRKEASDEERRAAAGKADARATELVTGS